VQIQIDLNQAEFPWLWLVFGLAVASLAIGCQSQPVNSQPPFVASSVQNASAVLSDHDILNSANALSERIVVPKDLVYGKSKTYSAIPLRRLLNQSGFNTPSINGELVATCSDGYKAVIPISEAFDGTGFLAFSDGQPNDPPGFSSVKTSAGVVDPQPLYLVWTNANASARKWPYQIQKIEIFASGWTLRLAEPSASASARRGFDLFQKNCSSCHSMNGAGGRVAVDLNVPLNVTEYWNLPVLRQLIVNAPSVRANAKMPAFPNLTPADVDAILAYLRDMRSRKVNN
jgi:mono/diheme cytochrome c family protein